MLKFLFVCANTLFVQTELLPQLELEAQVCFYPKLTLIVDTVFKIRFCFLSFKILFQRQSKHLRQSALGFLVGKYRISINKTESFLQRVILNIKECCVYLQTFLGKFRSCVWCIRHQVVSIRGGNCDFIKMMPIFPLSSV